MAYYTAQGAAMEVTGSCHHLKIGKIQILIDCGMFQGKDEELNYEEFGFDPKKIDYLILTHAHLDHIGRVPLLVKKGFNKKIICTKATYEIAKLMLANSANILQEKPKPLYNISDVEPALKLFGAFLEYNETMTLKEGIKIGFKNAGHILGAASVKIKFKEENIKKSVVFSGDIGQEARIITSKVDFWKKANTVFIESTYGASLHENITLSTKKFKKHILQTLNNKGTVVIPSFALERTQEILFLLKQMSQKGLLQGIPVYLDSPLAINVTKVFGNYPKLFSKKVQKMIEAGENPFDFQELQTTYSKEESTQINKVNKPKIIIAGSGMCEGGRVKYHLVRHLSDSNSLILFIGYQVQGTLGRKIINHNGEITIAGQHLKIEAHIEQIDGFSAHADQKGLLKFIDNLKGLDCVYLIHADEPKLEAFKEKIKETLHQKVHIVKRHESIYI
jgi:metallo-beta-lactamase family protein